MKLSIIIVNYNVKFFIEQCLISVYKAVKDIDAEILVVDNDSVDGSCQMIIEKFPEVILIENKENAGFSKANNQGIKKATGEYILLLNPDTLVEEDTFNMCVSFMEHHPKAGGLGVKMIDGKGNFLPESKRGLPSPWVSFCKIFGLSFLFPKSRIFSKYHLGYLTKNSTNEIEILPGAFMFIRKKVLDEIGLLDEDFFMYGEDIDLSYRILKAGYKNYYYPETTIIHYKGESTKKGSINYVMVFYNAMIIFARKHYSKRYAKIYSFLINMAIYFRAFLALIKRLFNQVFFPLLDACMAYGGFLIIRPYWEKYKFSGSGSYPDLFLNVIVPSYIIIWICAILISGGYSKPFKIIKTRRGIIFGTIIILIVYALLPEYLRFSRALIVLGTLWFLFSTHIVRWIINIFKSKNLKTEFSKKKKRIVIVGEKNEAERVFSILKYSQIIPDLIGIVSTDKKEETGYIGNINQLRDIIGINNIEEIIFCGKNLSSQEIIKNMLYFSQEDVEFKIAPPESLSIIGSNSINTAGDLYTVSFNSVTKSSNRKKKRIFDFLLSLILIIFSPFLVLVVKSQRQMINNLFQIIRGKLTFVGYILQGNEKEEKLKVKGVFYPHSRYKNNIPTQEAFVRIHTEYAQNYSVRNDFNIVISNILLMDKIPE